MNSMNRVERLFEKVWIGGMELRNRIVMPLTSPMFGDDYMDQRSIDFWVERAKGGAGLIIAGPGYTEPEGKYGRWGFLWPIFGIHDDRVIPALRKLTDSVHQYGAKIGFQIAHGGRYSLSSVTGSQPVSASAVYCKWSREMPRELTVPEIHERAGNYARATMRAMEAGFDVVELNCFSGYLIREFLSPITNRRTDHYGGGLPNRMRFLLEVIARIKEEVGNDYPLICKISGDEYLPGGNTLEEAKSIGRELERAGIDAISVAPGGHETTVLSAPGTVPRGAFTYLASGIKKEVSIPVITSHGITDPFLAERLLEEGKADLIGMGRPLIADPYFPNKAKEGRFGEIRRCVRCVQGCYDRVMVGAAITCLVNASVGKEVSFEIKPTSRKKKVVVVGGGPAGMETARVLALRGHQVTLYEKGLRLGGQLNLACIPPGKEEFRHLSLYLSGQLSKLGVTVNTGCEADRDIIEKESPDAVVIATGAKPIIPQIPGKACANVVTAGQVLTGEARPGQKTVVVGGGRVGCETALFLAKRGAVDAETALFLISSGALDPAKALSLARGDRDVIIVERLKAIGSDYGPIWKGLMRKLVKDHGIRVVTNASVEEISSNGVHIAVGEDRSIIDVDTVVMAVGLRSHNDLYKELEGSVAELYLIGDAKEPGKAQDAIFQGATIGREI